MKRPSLLAGLLLLLVFVYGCNDEKKKQYERPSWLTGKLYTVIENRPDLKNFKKCVDRHEEYREILARTQLLTVFAPNDEAFEKFFETSPYKSVEEMPRNLVRSIVEYHILFNAWSVHNLASTDGYGRIDPESDYRNEAIGFKKQTVFVDSIYPIKVVLDGEYQRIVRDSDPEAALGAEYWVHRDGFKYAPIFYDSYFGYLDLNYDDYEFYFDREYEGGTYFGGAKIIDGGADLAAENGFLHVVDKVVFPVENLEQKMLTSEGEMYDYTEFLDLIRSYAFLILDQDKTNEQAGAAQGGGKDIWRPSYISSIMPLDIGLEQVGGGAFGDDNMVHHPTLLAPTNKAFDELIESITGGRDYYKNFDELPDEVKHVIIRSYVRDNPTYKSNLDKGIFNLEGDSLFGATGVPAMENIVEKEFLSNGMFLGLDEAIVPKAFSTVAGPVYLMSKFSLYLQLCDELGLLSTVKNPSSEFTFCVIDDITFSNDSSLYIPEDDDFSFFQQKEFRYYDRTQIPAVSRKYSTSDMGILLNMVLEGKPSGIADVEFVRTLAGNYAVFEKQDDGRTTLKGSDPSLRGWSSDDTIIYPEPVITDVPPINGEVIELSAFLNFSSVSRLFGTIKSLGAGTYKSNNDPSTGILEYGFYDLLTLAGLVNETEASFDFLLDGSYYTVFIPTKDAIASYALSEGILDWATVDQDELRDFVRYHFIQKALLFTDGKMPGGSYKTLRISKSGGIQQAVYSPISIQPSPDQLSILDKNGSPYAYAKPGVNTNVMTYTVKSSSGGGEDGEAPLYLPHYTSGVVHVINDVLVYED